MFARLGRPLASFYGAGRTLSTSHILQGAPRLANRPFLPGSDKGGFPEFLAPPRPDFPKVIDAEDIGLLGKVGETPHDVGTKSRAVIDEALAPHPALLLRGLPLSSEHDFAEFCSGLGYKALGYESGTSPRDQVATGVLTASDEPPEFCIEPHNEMSYSSVEVPSKVAFFCVTPPQPGCGGETAIADVRDIWRDLDKPTVQGLVDKGIRYMNYFASSSSGPDIYVPWQQVMKTGDKGLVEEMLRTSGYGFEWGSDDSLHFWTDRSAFGTHPRTGEQVWFNQAHASHQSYFFDHPRFKGKKLPSKKYPFSAFYPDWSEIEPEVLQHIRSVTWHNAAGLQLQKGEVIFMDNYFVQHSRLGFSGDRRLVVHLMD